MQSCQRHLIGNAGFPGLRENFKDNRIHLFEKNKHLPAFINYLILNIYIYFFFFSAIKISLNKKRNYLKRLKGAEGVVSYGLHRGLERCRVYDIRNTFPLPHKFSSDKIYNHEKLLFSGRIFLNDFPCFIGWWFTRQITGKKLCSMSMKGCELQYLLLRSSQISQKQQSRYGVYFNGYLFRMFSRYRVIHTSPSTVKSVVIHFWVSLVTEWQFGFSDLTAIKTVYFGKPFNYLHLVFNQGPHL